MNVLVTGGAGYIGCHTTRELLDEGHQVVVLDDLSLGHRQAVDKRAVFCKASTSNFEIVLKLLKGYNISSVIHFAANTEVSQSISEPELYYHNNFTNTLSLLRAMRLVGVNHLVFSSTAAVYGNPKISPIAEDQKMTPINPYGRSKMMVELALRDFAEAYGLGYAILRYFNVAGAHPDGSIGEDHRPETHLIPSILNSARDAKEVRIFGTDYSTPDGTCVRDYIHVVDIARAHVFALRSIKSGEGEIFNVGSQKGFSVREVIAACEKVTGIRVNQVKQGRRSGDPATLVADSAKISARLGWTRLYPDLETIVGHAWNWHSKHPDGYGINSQL